jgi:hypothetical protein
MSTATGRVWPTASPPARGTQRMRGPASRGGCGRCSKLTALITDDTGFLKNGTALAYVAMQWTGPASNVISCQASVSLPPTSDTASAPMGWRLFLPGSWDPDSTKADPAKVARRTRCSIF